MTTSKKIIGLGAALFSWLALAANAHAGRGGSTAAIAAAVASKSEDAIVAEVERAEELACESCVGPVMALIDNQSPKVREVAGWWLSKRGVRFEVLTQMTGRLMSPTSPILARNAADVLRGLRDKAGLSALHSYLMAPIDGESGQAAARAIGTIGHPSSAAVLTEATKSSFPEVRAQAVASIREIRAPLGEAAPMHALPLLSLLIDADASVRFETAQTLGHLVDSAALDSLAQVVTTDSSARVRKAAAWAIGQIGQKGGADVTTSRTALTTTAAVDKDPLVRSIASAALKRLR